MSRMVISTLLALSWMLALPHAISAGDEGQAELFAKLDANGDGQLAAGEIEAEHHTGRLIPLPRPASRRPRGPKSELDQS